MNKTGRIAIVVALLVVAGVVIALKQARQAPTTGPAEQVRPDTQAASAPAEQVQPDTQAATPPVRSLPRLVDLGADKCIPCKMMAPILEELRAEYAGRLEVDFFDVWKDPGIGQAHGISLIPTQIFYAATGEELFRHEGFMSKEDILAKWKELGVDLSGGARTDD